MRGILLACSPGEQDDDDDASLAKRGRLRGRQGFWRKQLDTLWRRERQKRQEQPCKRAGASCKLQAANAEAAGKRLAPPAKHSARVSNLDCNWLYSELLCERSAVGSRTNERTNERPPKVQLAQESWRQEASASQPAAFVCAWRPKTLIPAASASACDRRPIWPTTTTTTKATSRRAAKDQTHSVSRQPRANESLLPKCLLSGRRNWARNCSLGQFPSQFHLAHLVSSRLD